VSNDGGAGGGGGGGVVGGSGGSLVSVGNTDSGGNGGNTGSSGVIDANNSLTYTGGTTGSNTSGLNRITYSRAAIASGVTIGGDINTASYDLTVQGDTLTAAASRAITGTGAVTIQSSGTSFAADFSAANWAFANTLTGLTIGKSGNTSNVTLANAITVDGNFAVYGTTTTLSGDITADAITIDSDLVLNEANVTLNTSASNGAVTITGDVTGGLSKLILTGSGAYSFWDYSNTGYWDPINGNSGTATAASTTNSTGVSLMGGTLAWNGTNYTYTPGADDAVEYLVVGGGASGTRGIYSYY
jgi:hypothetical protein